MIHHSPCVSIRTCSDFSPFGVELDGRTVSGGYRFGYQGSEQDNEFKGDGNSYTTEFRQLDPRLGRWFSVDPLYAKYIEISPYVTFINNSILFIDINGDSVARFNFNTGDFIGFFDDGKSTWSYQRGYYKNNSTEWKVVGSGKFNDAKVDIQAIRNHKIARIEIMTEKEVEHNIDVSGVKSVEARKSPVYFAWNEGDKLMDYGVNGIKRKDLQKNTFYVRDGIAYNVADIGNYLWGRGMSELGVNYSTAKQGAHVNNMINGRRQGTSFYDFGPGTYNSPGILDSQGDQDAIYRGYLSTEKGKKLYQKEIEAVKVNDKKLNKEVHLIKF